MKNCILEARSLWITCLFVTSIHADAQTRGAAQDLHFRQGYQSQQRAAQVSTEDIWVSAYYAGWMQGWFNNGRLPAENIDFSAVTHIIHFALVPNADGTLNDLVNSVHVSNSSALVRAAHAAGKKVLICVGGWGSNVDFRGATSNLNLLSFVSNLVSFVVARGYDGIDIDWETLDSGDSAQFVTFISVLRAALNALPSRPLLTAAVAWNPSIIAAVQDHLDQINIMTYDISGPWLGWATWHNSPIYDGGYTFASTGRPVPSADGMANSFTIAGIEPKKLGIGIDFYGYVWSGGSGTSTGGVTEPRQSWIDRPSIIANVPYYKIMEDYYKPEYYRWDTSAQASYLQMDASCNGEDRFVTYDDERTCEAKIQYVRQKGIGGVILWELGGGIREGMSEPDLLLQAVKRSVISLDTTPEPPAPADPDNGSQGVELRPTISWYSSLGASAYRVQCSSTPDFMALILDSTVTTATSLTLPVLDTGRVYHWRVGALSNRGSSPFSTPSAFTTVRTFLPPPEIAQPVDGARDVPLTLQFAWHPVNMAAAYLLQVNNAPDFCGTMADTAVVYDTVYTPRALRYSTRYYWRVKAMNAEASSDYSRPAIFTTVAGPPAPPVLVSPPDGATHVSSSPIVRWNVSGSSQTFRVHVAVSQSFVPTILDTSNLTLSFFQLVGLQEGTQYFWRVRARSATGESEWSESFTFTTGLLGTYVMVDSAVPIDFSLGQNFPNPFNSTSQFRFGLPVQSFVKVDVYSGLGQHVRSLIQEELRAGIYEATFNAGGLASGMYIMVLQAQPLEGDRWGWHSEARRIMLIK